MVSQALPPHSHIRTNSEPTLGLPPVPSSLPIRRHSDGTPDLQMFRIPLWSSVSANPNSRLYQRVAARRVTAASNPTAAIEGIKKIVLGRIDEDGAEERFRPLEDPYLVGEVAARKARAERLARENGDDILIREDKRWDWFLGECALLSSVSWSRATSELICLLAGQMKDVDERNLRWKEFRREMQHTGRLGRISRHLRG
jgi:hypothetical protein